MSMFLYLLFLDHKQLQEYICDTQRLFKIIDALELQMWSNL